MARASIDAALAADDIARAASLAEQALAGGSSDPVILNLVAWRREEAGDFAAAQALLARALTIAPGDHAVRIGLGAVMRKQGRLEEAVIELEAVTRERPAAIAAWLERGYALEELGRTRTARESFERAAALDPACAPAHAGVAAVRMREGNGAAAKIAAERALHVDPGNIAAHLARAASALAAGEWRDASTRLDRLLARADLHPLDRIQALTLRGDVLDRCGDLAGAFAAYAEANAAYRSFYAGRVAAQRSNVAFIEHITTGLERVPASTWLCAPGGDVSGASRLAFLFGHPRSGTTLTEQIVASLPGVSAIEERPTLEEASHAFLLPVDGMRRLAAMDCPTADRLRACYWRRVAAEGVPNDAAIVVDMDPLKSLRLPIIARLFPRARLLLMRRDPRDVVWSCFRRNFRFSAANYAFADLAEAAQHYVATMRLIERCRELLPIKVHDIRYERLVADFDGTTRDLCSVLGFAWSPALREFAATAHARGVTTASAAQVRKPLYDGGGQWRRYAAQLAPVLPILQPWVVRLGYS